MSATRGWYGLEVGLTAALVVMRVLAALYSNISDCDETFNYWEPTHYVLFKSGFQTWEYSPENALRSYTYLLLHTPPILLANQVLTALFGAAVDKIVLFYALRVALALLCAYCEIAFYKAVRNYVAGPQVAFTSALFLIASTGMFVSSAAFLPSSFAMVACMYAFSRWYERRNGAAVFFTGAAALVAWPFSGALGIPIAIDIALVQKRVVSFIKSGIISLVVLMGPLVLIDSYFYQRFVVAPLNIVLYNVLSGSTSSELYGTEPWHFYILNGVLNFNLAFVLALAAPACLVLFGMPEGVVRNGTTRVWLALAPFWVWMAIFLSQAHKEERFLFPIYPLVGLGASLGLEAVVSFLTRKKLRLAGDVLRAAVIGVFVLLSVSRTVALYKGYHAPLEVYGRLASAVPPPAGKGVAAQGLPPVRVCVGKEWYRFPTSFFLPEGYELEFVQSEFRAQLPGHFARENGTSVIPAHMNVMNKEEPSRYVALESCDALVDVDAPTETPLEPRYSARKEWRKAFCVPYLDSQRTSTLYRALYIPFLSATHTAYNDYCILQKVQ